MHMEIIGNSKEEKREIKKHVVKHLRELQRQWQNSGGKRYENKAGQGRKNPDKSA